MAEAPAIPAGMQSNAVQSAAVRRLILCLFVVLGLLAVRLAWGYYTDRLLRNHLDAIRANGQPLAAADYVFDAIPDADNAARYLQDAANAIVAGADSPRATNMVYPPYPPYDPAWMAAAEGSETANVKAFALAREARGHTRAQWYSQPMMGPLAMQMRGFLNSARHLANTLTDGATLAHVRGDDTEAIERLRDTLHLARSIHDDETTISQLVAIGIGALTCDAVMIIAPGLRLDSGSGATSAPATRAAAQALMAELLDEAMLQRGFLRGLEFERATVHEYIRGKGKGTWVIRPLATAQLVREHRNFDLYFEAAKLPDKPHARAALTKLTKEQPLSWSRGEVPRYSRWFADFHAPDRYLEMRFRVSSERRMAATSLAVQLFRADQGRWPADLTELIPKYLPAVPLDPYKVNDPIGYVVFRGALPDGRDRPMLFVRASETVDNDIGPFPEPTYSWENDRSTARRIIWQYRDLSRFVPPPASTQAVDEQP